MVAFNGNIIWASYQLFYLNHGVLHISPKSAILCGAQKNVNNFSGELT